MHRWSFDHPAGVEILDVQGGGGSGRMGIAVVQIFGHKCPGGLLQMLGGGDSWVNFDGRVGKLGRDDFTVALWFSTTSAPGALEIFSNRASPSHGNFFNIRLGQRGIVVAELDESEGGLNYVAVSSRVGLADGRWHHVAVRRQGTRVTLFLDGQQSVEGASPEVTDLSGGSSFQLGSSDVATQYNGHFQGFLDDVRVYRTALGNPEIEALYRDHKAELTSCRWRTAGVLNGAPVPPPIDIE